MANRGTLKASYTEGVPVLEAIVLLAPEALRRKYLIAHKRKVKKDEAFRRQQAEMLRSSVLDASGRAMFAKRYKIDLKRLDTDSTYLRFRPSDDSAQKVDSFEPERCVSAMAESFINAIHQGAYRAIGFEYPRRLHSKLQYFPDDILRRDSTRIDQRSSGIIGGGLHFVEVRLLPFATASERLQAEGDEESKSRSRKQEVMDACEELKQSGKIDLKESIKSIHDKVYDLLLKRTQDPYGLSYSALYPFIREFRESWKKSNRTNS